MSETDRLTVWSIHLPNEPQLRILLKFIAQRYHCEISPREYAGAANVVQGRYNNVKIVQGQFHAIRMAMYLERAMAVVRNSSRDAQTVETEWTRAFVSRAIELICPGVIRDYAPNTFTEKHAIAFANELLKGGAV